MSWVIPTSTMLCSKMVHSVSTGLELPLKWRLGAVELHGAVAYTTEIQVLVYTSATSVMFAITTAAIIRFCLTDLFL